MSVKIRHLTETENILIIKKKFKGEGLFTRGVLLNFYFTATNNTMAVTTKSNVLFFLN
jgi:hypothetical protein